MTPFARTGLATLAAAGIVAAGTLAFGAPVRADEPAAAAPPPSAAAAPAPAPAAAPDLPPEHTPAVQVSLEPRTGVRVGELLHLRITADATLGDDVTVADQSFAPFEVQKKQARIEAPNAGKQRFVFELDLLALEPGQASVPALSLRVVTKDGLVGDIATQAQPVTVRSWLGNEPNAQPKLESKPVVVMQDNWVPIYVLAGLAAAALIAAATLLVQRYLRKRRERALPPPPPRPPWDVAVEKLGELRRRKQTMIEAGKAALFVDQVSNVVREYLGGRFGFDGLETTTDEMTTLLEYKQAGVGFTQEVAQFLGRCDLVKFAKAEPDQDEADLLFAKANDLVNHSRPAPQPMAAAAPAAPTPGAGGTPS
jgi:hypothetical protein